MNNIQETLLFPVRDAEARKQFLIACAVALASFIIPILPMLVLMGYSAKIMRQIINEHREPFMPTWQSDDLSEMLLDGLRLWGAQLILTLPLLLLMGCGMAFLFGGSFSVAALADQHADSIVPIGVMLTIFGSLLVGLFGILSLPYSVIISAALPHVTVKRSFQAAFEFQEWFSIFRRALGQFILGYAVIILASFALAIAIQVAFITIILICVVPFLMVPFMVYQTLIMNSVFAQAYRAGREPLGLASHATA
jgi:hypothetical protein